jgi:hypothetical protein
MRHTGVVVVVRASIHRHREIARRVRMLVLQMNARCRAGGAVRKTRSQPAQHYRQGKRCDAETVKDSLHKLYASQASMRLPVPLSEAANERAGTAQSRLRAYVS